MTWVGDEATFKGLIDATPRDDVGWLHRFLYLTHFSYGKMRGKSFSPSVKGVEAKTIDRIEKFAPRLKRVQVFGGDYRKVVEKFDGKDAVHFLDPPYFGYNVDVGESHFDERAFFDVLKSLRGKFLVTYGIRGELPKLVKDGPFEVRRIRTRRSIASMRGVGGSSVLTQLLISNYAPTRKSLDALADAGWAIDDAPAVSVQVPEALKPPAVSPAFAVTGRLLKGVDPSDERFVLGIVLEPEVVDAQWRHLLGRRDPRGGAPLHGGVRRSRADAPARRERPGEGPRVLPRARRLRARRCAGAQGHVAPRRARALRRALGAGEGRQADGLLDRWVRAAGPGAESP